MMYTHYSIPIHHHVRNCRNRRASHRTKSPSNSSNDRQFAPLGPDAGGTFVDGKAALGQRRLSIIDLSTGANQPFFTLLDLTVKNRTVAKRKSWKGKRERGINAF